MVDRTQTEELRLRLLVLRCQAGDERAFAQLMNQFSGRTLGYLRGLVGDAAEDVQQDVWLAVYRGLSGLANPGAFRTWLYSTTRHRAIDFLRKRKRESELLAAVAIEIEVVTHAEVAIVEFADEDVKQLLDRLPPLHREVLVLRYQNDLSYAQIALIAGCSIGTIRSRLHHAKQRLHEIMTNKGDKP